MTSVLLTPEILTRARHLARVLRVILLGAVGGGGGLVLGTLLGRGLFPSYEARIVLRIATLGPSGPIIPLSEVRARTESRVGIFQHLASRRPSLREDDIDRFKVAADIDQSGASTVVTLSATGPDSDLALDLARDTSEDITEYTNRAWTEAMHDQEEQSLRARRASDAYANAAALVRDEATTPLALDLKFERWAGEVSGMREHARRAMALSRDTEVIDPAFVQAKSFRATYFAALGALGGLALGAAGGSVANRRGA